MTTARDKADKLLLALMSDRRGFTLIPREPLTVCLDLIAAALEAEREAGREEMREKAARVADEYAARIRYADRYAELNKQLIAQKVGAQDIALAIRSLPLKKDEEV